MSFSKGTPGQPTPMQRWGDMRGNGTRSSGGNGWRRHPHQWPAGGEAVTGGPMPPPSPQTPPTSYQGAVIAPQSDLGTPPVIPVGNGMPSSGYDNPAMPPPTPQTGGGTPSAAPQIIMNGASSSTGAGNPNSQLLQAMMAGSDIWRR